LGFTIVVPFVLMKRRSILTRRYMSESESTASPSTP
jgi:hypothetical protein